MQQDLYCYVVDDDPHSRESICNLLSLMGMRASEYYSSADFLEKVPKSSAISCLITDMRMPGESGIELIRELRARGRELPIIVVSAYVDVADAVKAMQLGAVSVLTKPFKSDELRDALEAAFRIARSKCSKQQRRVEMQQLFSQLSSGEWLVLECIDIGLANKVTANRLDISMRTVEDRRRRILSKLSVDNIASLLHLVNEARELEIKLGYS